ncbi:LysR family transcriptional regulator [Marmoricola endophyticus]|uniref:LysR family transcriptional regulator n=1 Tax=Marmoricola endophyticus TaxID=2040280 RepID=A0A917BLQ8_9ACTN|nr:LysR family transcriptional regulator [Marmoricola endophyticus]GGF51129.1 LysR family transcriptional regulator [Marmoricola endophyticus]
MQDVELPLVRTFLVLADELNFRRAAERLFIAQPALSQRIARLEEKVGMRLFDRTTRRVELTFQGRELVPTAMALVSAQENFASRASALSSGRTDELRVAYTVSTGYDVVPGLVSRFRHHNPDVEVLARETWGRDVVAGLRTRAFDVAIGRVFDPPDDMEAIVLRHEGLVATLGEDHPLAGRTSLRLADLDGEQIMFWPRELAPLYHDLLLSICRAGGCTPRIVHNPIPGQRILTRLSGDVLAIRPESCRFLRPDGLVLVDLVDEVATVPVMMMWPREHRSPNDVAAWRRNAEAFADFAGWKGYGSPLEARTS